MSRISVLMPARNAATTIFAAAKSTLRALPSDGELFVYDDGSTDETLREIDKVTDKRLHVVQGKGNIGVSGALNLLLASTDSDYVARMDADDLTLPGRFSAQLSAVQGEADVVFGGIINFGKDIRGLRPSWPHKLSPEVMALALLVSNPVAHSTMFAKRERLASAGGYRGCRAEDYDFWLRLAANGTQLVRLARPVVAYRHHSGQVTSARGWFEMAFREGEVQESLQALSMKLLGVPIDQPAKALETFSHCAARFGGADKSYLLRRARERFGDEINGKVREGDY